MLAAAFKPVTSGGGGSAATTTRYILSDQVQSTNVVLDSNGAIVQTLDYNPYGDTRINNKTSSYDTTAKYIGQPNDASTNLDYFNARYFSAPTAKFISQDPVSRDIAMMQKQQIYILDVNGRGGMIDQTGLLSQPQGLNFYSYANGNPITKSDPSGLTSGDMGFFTNIGMPSYAVQAKYDAIKVGVGLPFATMMSAGILSSAVLAPEVAGPVAGSVYQGTLVGVALRATNDARTGKLSSGIQYGGSALFGGTTGYFTAEAGLLRTMGITGVTSGFENKILDGSVQPGLAGVNAGGAGAGYLAGKAVSSIPALKPFSTMLAPAVNSFTTYGVTALSTTAVISDKKK